MRVLITGAEGQLGQALQRQFALHDVLAAGRSRLDVADLAAVRVTVDAFRPRLVVHAAAFTNVDECERQPELAFRVNALGCRNVAVAAAAHGAAVVAISTNYVFDGEAAEPYHEWHPTRPISVYGASKLAGEELVRDHAGGRHYIVRTSWLYAASGRNFVQTMLHLAATQSVIKVVNDQFGQPTYVADLAAAVAQLAETRAYGTYHLTNAGGCSWFDWAHEALTLAGHGQHPHEPIPASAFQRAARPPTNGLLHNWAGAAVGITLRPWQEALADCLQSGALPKETP